MSSNRPDDTNVRINFRVEVSHDDEVVVMTFGKFVEWLGMPPQIARQLADKLRKHADLAEKSSKEGG